MEYVFGTVRRRGEDIEVLKTKGPEHTDLKGFQQLQSDYPDQIITDDFHVVRKYDSQEDVEGNCYDWYEIDHHSRYTDKWTPAKPKIEGDIAESQDAVCELDELADTRMGVLEDAVCELDEIINGGANDE